MKIAVLGTGMVGNSIATKLVQLGHEVKMGSRAADNDKDAKAKVIELLRDGFGWKAPIDLGDITNARATEMLLPIWVRLYGAFGSPMFNFKIVK